MRVDCPICHQTTTWEENRHRPFCSERCRMIDLGHWATAAYRVPAEHAPPMEGEAETSSNDTDDASTHGSREGV